MSETRRDREWLLHGLDLHVPGAALDPSTVSPDLLLLVQASLQLPPTEWRKHSLPCLARHVRKLCTEINPREQERLTLARVNEFRCCSNADES